MWMIPEDNDWKNDPGPKAQVGEVELIEIVFVGDPLSRSSQFRT